SPLASVDARRLLPLRSSSRHSVAPGRLFLQHHPGSRGRVFHAGGCPEGDCPIQPAGRELGGDHASAEQELELRSAVHVSDDTGHGVVRRRQLQSCKSGHAIQCSWRAGIAAHVNAEQHRMASLYEGVLLVTPLVVSVPGLGIMNCRGAVTMDQIVGAPDRTEAAEYYFKYIDRVADAD